ncbi:uncharacterized protein DEA37_0014321 [Paragonimus westermani]|uniref:Uncharacterized protein n=1 Tax=Paragonimus westermani TaxID=34504 RepID=A0A5J4NEV5_9TREM|nr:uncharacterized protein DEA37_0014321 [Paragonimus westermani]
MSKIGRGFQVGLSWIHAEGGHVPPKAIDAGGGVYVGRMHHAGDLIPGKVIPRFGHAYCSHAGQEHTHSSYEVLCDTCAPSTRHCYRWEYASGGHVPKSAIVAGLADNGSPLYIARVEINGERVVGKVHDGHPCAYFPYGGEEHRMPDYEVLVLEK